MANEVSIVKNSKEASAVQPPKVSVIIIHLFGVDYLANCLASVFQSNYPNLEVTVVFNGALGSSFAFVKEKFPQAITILNKKNLGYSKANNQGIKQSIGEAIFLLNDDTIIHPEVIGRMAEELFSDKKIGIVGPKIYYLAERQKIWFAGGIIDWSKQASYHLGKGLNDSEYGDQKKEVDFITGCALMIKKEVVEKIGLLDETFFAFYEDADWCQRAKNAGYKIFYVPFGGVWHAKSATAGRVFFGEEKNKNLFWLGATYFLRCFLKEWRIFRNKFIFFNRYLAFGRKMKFFARFALVDFPVFLAAIFYQIPRSFLAIAADKITRKH